MARSTIKSKIERFCEERGYFVPSGFHRHPASRYVAIVENDRKWKLVARTWFTVEDLIYYLDHDCGDRNFMIFDFKNMRQLKRRGETQVEAIEPITIDA